MEIAKKMGIMCFQYIKSPTELKNIQNQLKMIIESIAINAKENFEMGEYDYKVDGFYDEIHKVLKKINMEIKKISLTYLEEIEQKQQNALTKGVADNFYTIRARNDSSKLNKELDKIKKRSKVRKFFDKITGQEGKKQARVIQIENMMRIIQKKKDSIEKNKMSEPNQQYDIIDIFSDMEIFIKENEGNNESKEHVEAVLKMQEQIKKIYEIEEGEIEQTVARKCRERLPVIIQKRENKKKKAKTEEEKVEDFLRDNGYTPNEIKAENGLEEYHVSGYITGIEDIPNRIQRVIKFIGRYLNSKDRNESREIETETETGIGENE